MATRPIFLPCSADDRLVQQVDVSFQWNPGFSPTQKKNNIRALHNAASLDGYKKLLEVSTKSDEELGVRLSAFNLNIRIPAVGVTKLECTFQGSKVFRYGGPYVDLYESKPVDAKRDPRLKESGELIGFSFLGQYWELEPKTAFYDWLYLQALYRHRDELARVEQYLGFTDIEFNPKKSVNCQARSCAIVCCLKAKGLVDEVVNDRERFIQMVRADSLTQPQSISARQQRLL